MNIKSLLITHNSYSQLSNTEYKAVLVFMRGWVLFLVMMPYFLLLMTIGPMLPLRVFFGIWNELLLFIAIPMGVLGWRILRPKEADLIPSGLRWFIFNYPWKVFWVGILLIVLAVIFS